MMRDTINVLKKTSLLLEQTRSLRMRPNIAITSEKYRLSVVLRDYGKDEIQVRVSDGCLVVEGWCDRQCADGRVTRRMVRRFTLPSRCQLECTTSQLAADGTLTITVPRNRRARGNPCEIQVPVQTPADLVPINTQEETKKNLGDEKKT